MEARSQLWGAVGEYVESLEPPAIGTVVGPFSASCAVDRDWGGQGTFSYGRYNVGRCVVTNIAGQSA